MNEKNLEPVSSIFEHPQFILFWLSRVLSTGAFQIQSVAIGWQVYSLSGSALDLGFVGLAQFLPVITLTFIVGHVADRYDRRIIIVVCQIVGSITAALLAFGSVTGAINMPMIFIAASIIGTARAFEGPAMAALVSSLVPRPVLPQATAWSTSANQTAQIVGPAIGGLLFGLGASITYSAACGTFICASLLAGLIQYTPSERNPKPITLQSLFSGLAFIKADPVILGTLSLDLFAVLLGGATALLPIYARDILLTGPWGLGFLRSAPAVGALAMSIVLSRYPLRHQIGPKLFAAVIIFGLATIVFSISNNLALSLAALFVIGASNVVSVVIRFALVQLRTPDEMRGRVSAVNSAFVGTSNQLGEFESGVLAALFGAVPA
ncbi:MAG TPA: MFS transporter, partial [Xanthobacteraceae bacterium]|nr:MFS transporter [Xanthobacteraceae bacterium]